LPAVISKALRKKGPVIVEIILDPLQPMMPKVISERKKDGRMVSRPIEDMYPFLQRDEFHAEMIVKPVEEKPAGEL
jgi:acetolactate synthase-1/2/3 large subunit